MICHRRTWSLRKSAWAPPKPRVRFQSRDGSVSAWARPLSLMTCPLLAPPSALYGNASRSYRGKRDVSTAYFARSFANTTATNFAARKTTRAARGNEASLKRFSASSSAATSHITIAKELQRQIPLLSALRWAHGVYPFLLCISSCLPTATMVFWVNRVIWHQGAIRRRTAARTICVARGLPVQCGANCSFDDSSGSCFAPRLSEFHYTIYP